MLSDTVAAESLHPSTPTQRGIRIDALVTYEYNIFHILNCFKPDSRPLLAAGADCCLHHFSAAFFFFRSAFVSPRVPACLHLQRPESMVAETLKMKGELEFTRLLRVDGRFQGELITDKGSLVVGPKGEVIGDLKNMQVQCVCHL